METKKENEGWNDYSSPENEGSNRENNQDENPNERSTHSRINSNEDGSTRPHRPRFSSNNRVASYNPYYNKEGNEDVRSPRPRYNSNNREGGGYNRDNEGYRPRYNSNNREGGGYNRDNEGYRPRYNSNNREGGGYNRDNEGYRPRYNSNNREGGGYNRDNEGYRPRYNSNNREGGGYNRDNEGYRPRYNNEEYRPRYNSNNRDGGYNRDNGGYRPRYGNDRPQSNRRFNSSYNSDNKYSIKKRIEYKEQNVDPNEPIRLNKFLANAGVCSRREADEFILAGTVLVNGVVVKELGSKIKRSDEVKFHDQIVRIEKKVYVLLNKPKNCVTTSDDPQERHTVMDLVKDACGERIYPVGRLDRNTTGVLLLTNDGDLASKLTHPKFLKKKIYQVTLDKNVIRADLDKIVTNISLEDGDIHADAAEYVDDEKKNQIGIEIHSGKNRIVRRMFESLDYKVIKLDRVFFAGLTKKGLRRGEWRYLTEREVDFLRMGSFE